MTTQRLLLGAALLAASTSLAADTTPSGWLLNPIASSPNVVATLSTGEFVAFDGTTIGLYDDAGGLVQVLGTLTNTDFASFVRIDPTETFVVVGESLNGGIYRAELDGSGSSFIASLTFNYDAVFADGTTLYVSAANDTNPADNEVYRLHLSSGVSEQVAALDGASGPVALDASGNLYYGTAVFPVPATGAEVLRFGAAQLAGGTVLTNADATLVGDGFPGASSLAYDAVLDDLYLAASDFVTGVNGVYLVEGNASASPLLLDGTPGEFLFNLEFLPGTDPDRVFRAYQPDGGGELRYSNFGGRSSIATLRPQAFLSGPGLVGPGDLDVNVADAPANGLAYTLYGPQLLVPGTEAPVFLGNQGLNVFLGLDLFTLEADVVPFSLDGSGTGAKTYTNPGGLQGTLAIQVLVLDDMGSIANTSDVLVF